MSGALIGVSLLKPHLVIPLILLLDYKAPRRWLFRLGIAAALLLSFAPFLSGYRPITDLRDMTAVMKKHAVSLYSRDEQGFLFRVMDTAASPAFKTEINSYDISKRSNFLVPPALLYRLNGAKLLFFATTLALWFVVLRLTKQAAFSTLAAVSLTLGVLASIYSHLYDGLLLIPLLLIAVHNASQKVALSTLMGWGFFINMALAFGLMFDRHLERIHWTRTGWTSLIYLAIICFLALFCNTDVTYKRYIYSKP